MGNFRRRYGKTSVEQREQVAGRAIQFGPIPVFVMTFAPCKEDGPVVKLMSRGKVPREIYERNAAPPSGKRGRQPEDRRPGRRRRSTGALRPIEQSSPYIFAGRRTQ